MEFIQQAIDFAKTIVSTLNTHLTEVLNGNSMMAGVATLAIISSCFYVFRRTPARIWFLIKKHVLYTYNLSYVIDITVPISVSGTGNSITMLGIILEKSIQNKINNIRNNSNLVIHNSKISETLSDGVFYMKLDGIICRISRRTKTGDDGIISPSFTPIDLSISTLRINRKRLKEYIDAQMPAMSTPGIYNCFMDSAPIRLKTLRPNIEIDLNEDERILIDQHIDSFIARFAVDETAKLTILTYGEPGTGKSTISEYVANRVQSSVFVLSGDTRYGRSGTTTSTNISYFATTAISAVPRGTPPVLLADDIDAMWPCIDPRKVINGDTSNNAFKKDRSIELSMLLRSLQSPVSYSGAIAIMNTNHLDKIDPAVYRTGRVDLLIEIKRLKPETIKKHYERVYGLKWDHPVDPLSWRACDIAAFKQGSTAEQFVAKVTNPNEQPADLSYIDELREVA